MTPRERVLSTAAHQEPDRLPVGEWGIDHDHVERILGVEHSYWRNRRSETIALWEGRRDELVEGMISDYTRLVEALDYDLVPVSLVPPRGFRHPDPPRRIDEETWEDGAGRVYRYAASNDSIVCVTPPQARESLSETELDTVVAACRRPFEAGVFDLLDALFARFGAERALVFRDMGLFETLMDPFGGDETHKLIIPLTRPEAVAAVVPAALERAQRLIDEVSARGASIVMDGKDYCMNTGPMFTPGSLRELFFPYQARVVEAVEEAGMLPFFHCCGKTWDVLDDFVAAGWKGYQSVQKTAGMDWARLKREYGNVLTIWAGVSCETLIEGDAEDVEGEVREAIEVLSPGGGFIFGSTNSVQYGARTDNYLRALEIAREFRY